MFNFRQGKTLPLRGSLAEYNGSEFFYWTKNGSFQRVRINRYAPPNIQRLSGVSVEISKAHVTVKGRNKLQFQEDREGRSDILLLAFETLLFRDVKGKPLSVFSEAGSPLTQRIYLDRISYWKNTENVLRLKLRGFAILYPGDYANLLYHPPDLSETSDSSYIIKNDRVSEKTLVDRML